MYIRLALRLTSGTRLSPPIPAHAWSAVITAFCRCSIQLVRSFAATASIDTTPTRDVRASAISFGGVIHRIRSISRQLPHSFTGPFRFFTDVSASCPDILRSLPETVHTKRKLCVFRMHMRPLPGLRRRARQRALARPNGTMSPVRRRRWQVQAVSARHQMSRDFSFLFQAYSTLPSFPDER